MPPDQKLRWLQSLRLANIEELMQKDRPFYVCEDHFELSDRVLKQERRPVQITEIPFTLFEPSKCTKVHNPIRR
ncbi:hypothetical protein M8J75_002846 [Diaphorina citri]|nr:hypothetical protein M8J75_002846 [Diaphorina citri]